MRGAVTAVFGAENACAELAKQAAMRTDVVAFIIVVVSDAAERCSAALGLKRGVSSSAMQRLRYVRGTQAKKKGMRVALARQTH